MQGLVVAALTDDGFVELRLVKVVGLRPSRTTALPALPELRGE
jgi:hypothetical protein